MIKITSSSSKLILFHFLRIKKSFWSSLFSQTPYNYSMHNIHYIRYIIYGLKQSLRDLSHSQSFACKMFIHVNKILVCRLFCRNTYFFYIFLSHCHLRDFDYIFFLFGSEWNLIMFHNRLVFCVFSWKCNWRR